MINIYQLSKSYETKVLKIFVFGLCNELPVKRHTFYGTLLEGCSHKGEELKERTGASEPEFLNF
jgi:hypothetical protein